MNVRRRQALALTAVACAVLTASGCATPRQTDPAAAEPAQAEQPLLTPAHPATVLDDGDGPELCMGAILTSYPPQCGGPALIGWDWEDVAGDFTDEMGVRWGEFVVTGTFDAERDEFTVADVRAATEHDWPQPDGAPTDMFATPCLEPGGGWVVADATRTTVETMDAVFERARSLPGYAAGWVDQSRNPAHGDPDTPDIELTFTDPLHTVVNVSVTEDPQGAEAALREVWGGMLCVSEASRSEAELQAIAEEIRGDGLLGSNADGLSGVVNVEVVYDDGALQRSLDEEYGSGVVVVSSQLVPAE